MHMWVKLLIVSERLSFRRRIRAGQSQWHAWNVELNFWVILQVWKCLPSVCLTLHQWKWVYISEWHATQQESAKKQPDLNKGNEEALKAEKYGAYFPLEITLIYIQPGKFGYSFQKAETQTKQPWTSAATSSCVNQALDAQ